MVAPKKKATTKTPAKITHSPLMGIVRENLRNLRIARGWTQRRLADALGVSQAYLAEVEAVKGKKQSGTRPVHLDFLHYAAAALGVTAVDLLVPGKFPYAGDSISRGRKAGGYNRPSKN